MPIDINLLREGRGGDPEKVRESQRRRFVERDLVGEILEKDDRWRQLTGDIDQLRKKKNAIQAEITAIRKAGGVQRPEMNQEIAEYDREVKSNEEEVRVLKQEIDALLGNIGNIVGNDVPVSKDEANNQVVATWGECRREPGLLNHHHLLTMIGGYEPERGVNVAGHRAYFLRDVGVLLNQALINYSITFLRNREYSVLQPPYFMNKEVMAGVAQLSDFDEALYHVQAEHDDKYLIATSEQPICAFHKGEWMQETQLPIRYGGVSTCFRKESGSHGKDTWGIFRVHQFDKIEQFVLCDGDLDTSNRMHEELSQTAQEFYQSLGLPYHVVNIVSGELNNAAIKKYDLEGWFPGYNSYRELVSCSNCTDYQSRAMEIRCGSKKLNETNKKYVHMLNATLCACTRTICCILENYQTPSGIQVPEVLVPFMGGMTFLPFVREAPVATSAEPSKNAAAQQKKKKEKAPAAQQKQQQKQPKESKSSNENGNSANEATAVAAPAPIATPAPPAATPVVANGGEAEAIVQAITAKGDEIRQLKESKAGKDALTPHIEQLLALKAQYKSVTGQDYIAPNTQGTSKKKSKATNENGAAQEESKKQPTESKPAPKAQPQPAPKAQPSQHTPAVATANGVNLTELDELLMSQSFVNGYLPSQEDVRMLHELTNSDGNSKAVAAWITATTALQQLPNVMRWLDFMIAQHPSQMARW